MDSALLAQIEWFCKHNLITRFTRTDILNICKHLKYKVSHSQLIEAQLNAQDDPVKLCLFI